jgi:hypothetical protein
VEIRESMKEIISSLAQALTPIPSGLREPLIYEFEEAQRAYRHGNWETVGLKAGKICEITFTILTGYLHGSYSDKPSKPRNMVDSCNQLANVQKNTACRSVKIQIPRLVIALYELRNNRDIGHVGGDVEPSRMDAELFLRGIKWIMCQLVRVFHKLNVHDAQCVVEALSERNIPVIWHGNGKTRVLQTDLAFSDKVLLVLYARSGSSSDRELFDSVEYSNFSVFRSRLLKTLHSQKMLEYDRSTGEVTILPPGIAHAEAKILSATGASLGPAFSGRGG